MAHSVIPANNTLANLQNVNGLYFDDLCVPAIFLICRQEIRTSTSSMTSVPKPLKFLRPHYGTLKAHYETLTDSDIKVSCLVGR